MSQVPTSFPPASATLKTASPRSRALRISENRANSSASDGGFSSSASPTSRPSLSGSSSTSL
ncbi:MAG: hypothetical protein ACP5I3_06805 [Thermoproteus sp.]